MSFMVGESGYSKGNRYTHYKCVNAKRTKNCDKKAVKKEWIENIVVYQVMETIMDDDLIDRIIDSFVNAIILYDDRIEFHFNYKEGAKELSIDEIKENSDLFPLTPPQKVTFVYRTEVAFLFYNIWK